MEILDVVPTPTHGKYLSGDLVLMPMPISSSVDEVHKHERSNVDVMMQIILLWMMPSVDQINQYYLKVVILTHAEWSHAIVKLKVSLLPILPRLSVISMSFDL